MKGYLLALPLILGLLTGSMADTGTSPPASGDWTLLAPTVIDTANGVNGNVAVDFDLTVDGVTLTVDIGSVWTFADGVDFTLVNGAAIVVDGGSSSAWSMVSPDGTALGTVTISDAELNFGPPAAGGTSMAINAAAFNATNSVFAYDAGSGSSELEYVFNGAVGALDLSYVSFQSSQSALAVEDCEEVELEDEEYVIDSITCGQLAELDSYPSPMNLKFTGVSTANLKNVTTPLGEFSLENQASPEEAVITVESSLFGNFTTDSLAELTVSSSFVNVGMNVFNTGKNASSAPTELLIETSQFNDEVCAALILEAPIVGTVSDNKFGDQLVAGRPDVDNDVDLDVVYLSTNTYTACDIDFEYPVAWIVGGAVFVVLFLVGACNEVRRAS